MMLGKVKWIDQTSSTSLCFSGITEKEEGEGPGVPQNTGVFVLLFDWLRAEKVNFEQRSLDLLGH